MLDRSSAYLDGWRNGGQNQDDSKHIGLDFPDGDGASPSPNRNNQFQITKDGMDMNDSTSFHQCSGGRKRGEHGQSAGSVPANHSDQGQVYSK